MKEEPRTRSPLSRSRAACPRFLLLHIIFGHCPFDGLEPNQPPLQGNLPCRRDWLQPRRTARSVWQSYPSKKLPPTPWCTVCEHLRGEVHLEARRASPAHAGWMPWFRCADKINWKLRRATDAVFSQRSASTQCLLLSLARALRLRARANRVTAASLGKNPLGVEQNIRNLTNLSLVSSQIPWIFCPTAVSRLKNQQGAQENGVAAWSLLVQATYSLGAQHGREEHTPRSSCGAPRPRRDGAHTLAGAGGPRAPALANAAGSAALRNGTDGATAAVVSSEHKVARVPRNKQLST